MEIKLVLEECYFVKSSDRIAGTVRTDVYKHENGIFQAFSSHAQDKEEEFVGFGESYDDKTAIRLSRKSLRKEWIESIK